MGTRWRAVGLAVWMILGLAQPGWASVGARDHDGTYLGEATEIKGKGAMADGSTFTRQGERCVGFAPSDFVSINAGISLPIKESNLTTPSLTARNSRTALVWYDNETSVAEKRFRVPDGYASNGFFRALLGREGANRAAIDTVLQPAIDFQVFVDKDVTAFDSAATDQTSVLVTSVGDGSPVEKTLSVTTDFASLTEGDWVTLQIWRDNTNTSTDSLLVYGLEFCYTGWE